MKYRLSVKPEELSSVFREVDSNRDSVVDLEEFVRFCVNRRKHVVER